MSEYLQSKNLGSRPKSGPQSRLKEDVSRAPEVLEYQDYRKYLSDWFSWRKLQRKEYSGALFARRAGLQSHTLLGMVIRGKRNLTPHSLRAFTRAIPLRGRKAKYFENLVFFNQAQKSEDKTYYLDQLHKLATQAQDSGSGSIRELRAQSRYIEHWYVVAVRELVSHPHFHPDPDWIVDALKGNLSRKQAEEAWKILTELQLVDFREGRWMAVDSSIEIDPQETTFALRNFYKDFLRRTADSIDVESYEERELGSFTVALDLDEIEEVRELLRDFRKKLHEMYPSKNLKSEQCRVVTISSQMMILSKKEVRKGKGK